MARELQLRLSMPNNNRHNPRIVLASLALICVLAIPTSGSAFAIRLTEAGEKVRWEKAKIEFVLDESLSALGPLEEVEDAIIDAFDTWVDMADLPMRFSFVRGICDAPGYREGKTNLNCIMVLEDYWDEGSDPGATAVVSYGSWSGHIKDADIVFNLDSVSNIVEIGAKMDRIRNVALHEVGHVLGLSHTDIDQASMFPLMDDSMEGTVELHDDDIDGAASLYEGLDTDVGPMGCSVVNVAAMDSPELAYWLIIAALGLLWRVRRR